MADNTQVRLDVLVYATGFDTHSYMRPMTVTGLNGTTIEEAWRETIYSYGGIALTGFPICSCCTGRSPRSIMCQRRLGLDQEIACIMRLIAEARARRAAVAPTVAATEKFLAWLGAAFPGTSGSAAARIGMPAIRARRSCGHCRRASARHSSPRCQRKISHFIPTGQGD
jgi:hypothetical protein